MADMKVNYAGLEFKNPVIAVSGPLGRTYEALKRSIEAGAAAVTLKSSIYVPRELEQLPKKPGFLVYPKPAHVFLRKYGLPKMMINWEGVPGDFTAKLQKEMILKIKPLAKKHNTRIIANLNLDLTYIEHQDVFRKDIRTLLEAEPDLIEFTPCPYHFPPEMTFPEYGTPMAVADLMTKVVYPLVKEEAGDVPVIAKANGALFLVAYEALQNIGVRNIHLTEGPPFYGAIVDIETMKPLVPGLGVMTYGQLRRPLMNREVAMCTKLEGAEISSSGGIWSTHDCIERIMCGAKLIGLHTAIQYNGHKLFTEVINGISEFLDRKKLKLSEIVGVAAPYIVNQEAHEEFMREHDISNDHLRLSIDMERCTSCGICANCIHGGIALTDEGEPKVNLKLCVRCGICSSLCPQDAIALEKV